MEDEGMDEGVWGGGRWRTGDIGEGIVRRTQQVLSQPVVPEY